MKWINSMKDSWLASPREQSNEWNELLFSRRAAAIKEINQSINQISFDWIDLIWFIWIALPPGLLSLSFLSIKSNKSTNFLVEFDWLMKKRREQPAFAKSIIPFAFSSSFLLKRNEEKANGDWLAPLFCRPAGWNFIQSIHSVHCFHSILYFYNRLAPVINQFSLFHSINFFDWKRERVDLME